MNKRKIRCFIIYVHVRKYYNVEVLYPNTGAWSDIVLFMCSNCGELFSLETNTESIEYFIEKNNKSCPTCNSSLKSTLVRYPDFFRAPDGIIENFKVPLHFSDSLDIKIIEVWDLGTN